MKPQIDAVSFGSIAIDGETIKHDIVITLDGEVKKRKKKLSKVQYGTSHILSLAEVEATLEKATARGHRAEMLIVGTGHFDRVRMSPEAQTYLEGQGCEVRLLPIKKAAKLWNEVRGQVIGLFHITC